jgi:hypothetical protein
MHLGDLWSVKMNIIRTVLAATTFAAMSSVASAATLTFGPTGWDYNEAGQVPWVVSIDDNTAGEWNVSLSIASGPGTDTGAILGFGFDTSLVGLTAASFALVSANTVEVITGTFQNAVACGGGCNFNGATNDAFDWIIRLGKSGTSDGLLNDIVFKIFTAETLALDSFTRVGIRAQGVGAGPNGGTGSAKDIHDDPDFDTPATVPLPAAGWLMLAGLGGIAAFARRRAV